MFYPPNYKIHASGHASQEELLTVLRLARPKFFLPWHGEPRHQLNHARIAQTIAQPPRRTLVAKNGDVVRLTEDEFKVTGTVPAGALYVDGLGVGDVGDDIMLERIGMSQEGVLVVTALLNPTPHVDIVSRGFVKSNRELDNQICKVALEASSRACARRSAPKTCATTCTARFADLFARPPGESGADSAAGGLESSKRCHIYN